MALSIIMCIRLARSHHGGSSGGQCSHIAVRICAAKASVQKIPRFLWEAVFCHVP